MTDMTLRFLVIVALFGLSQAEQGAQAPKQNCDGDKFSCDNNNPCNPACSETQTLYPGTWPNKYVRCAGVNNAYCTENKCARDTTWNQEHGRCEGENGEEARCVRDTYNCEDRNPCYPTLCDESLTAYPFVWHSKYITCGECGDCTINSCGPDMTWDQELQECVDEAGSGDERCSSAAFDCEDNNPCSPELCTPGKTYYPNSDPAMYVQCGSGAMCFLRSCAPGTVWNDDIRNCDFP